MKKAFTMMEIIFVIVIIGILAGIAIPRYLVEQQASHEANLISFVKTLNSTTGVDFWSKSLSEGKKGSIINLSSDENASFLSKYITIPEEIDKNDINFSKCGNGEYKTIMTANSKIAGGDYNVTCKDGTLTTAPYFRLIRLKDNKILVRRD